MSFPIAVKIGVGNTSIATPSNDKQYKLQKRFRAQKINAAKVWAKTIHLNNLYYNKQ